MRLIGIASRVFHFVAVCNVSCLKMISKIVYRSEVEVQNAFIPQPCSHCTALHLLGLLSALPLSGLSALEQRALGLTIWRSLELVGSWVRCTVTERSSSWLSGAGASVAVKAITLITLVEESIMSCEA